MVSKLHFHQGTSLHMALECAKLGGKCPRVVWAGNIFYISVATITIGKYLIRRVMGYQSKERLCCLISCIIVAIETMPRTTSGGRFARWISSCVERKREGCVEKGE